MRGILQMMKTKTRRVVTANAQETERLGEVIGRSLRGGEIIELTSDLGGGKTTFVRGLAKGMGSSDHVSSPTYKISNLYRAGKLELAHYDLYRLPEPGLMQHELNEVLDDPKVVVALEWADTLRSVLPEERLRFSFRSSKNEEREIDIEYPDSLSYTVEEVT